MTRTWDATGRRWIADPPKPCRTCGAAIERLGRYGPHPRYCDRHAPARRAYMTAYHKRARAT
jgi:hypothetical protein